MRRIAPGEGVVGLLLRGMNDLTDSPIDLLCHLLSGVTEQLTCMRWFYFAGGFGTDVLELKLTDEYSQGRIAVGICLDDCFILGSSQRLRSICWLILRRTRS